MELRPARSANLQRQDGMERQTKMVYSAVPNRMQIQVIEPTTPKVAYTISTQPVYVP